jgi:hypothetical protein
MGNNRAFISGDTVIWKYDGTTISAVNSPPGVFTIGGRPMLETWGNFVLATNAQDAPKIWKNTGQFVDLAGRPPAGTPPGAPGFLWCRQLIRRQPYVLALRTNESPFTVRWCSAGNVEDWIPVPENSAGSFDIRDITGEIRGGAPLGDAIGIYSDEAVTVASYIGLPYVFSFVTTLHGFGIYGPKSVVPIGRENYGIGPQGIFQTDGYSYTLLGDDNFRKWLKDNVDVSTDAKRHEITTLHNEFTDTVQFHFPVKSGGYSSLYWKLDRQKFTMGNLRVNAAVEREVFPYPLVGVSKDLCYLTRDVQTWDGAKFKSIIKTKWLDAGTIEFDKFVDHIFLNGKIDNLDIEVWMQDIKEVERQVLVNQDAQKQNWILQEDHKLQITMTAEDDFHLSRVRAMGDVGAQSL